MRRREFLSFVGGVAATWPLVARAQQGERARRVGILMPFPPTNTEMQARVRAFREELRKRGWATGVNAQFDERWTSDHALRKVEELCATHKANVTVGLLFQPATILISQEPTDHAELKRHGRAHKIVHEGNQSEVE
ncbi:MAG: hypothetical protein ABWY82_23720 [Tardiphaga sp.]